MIKCDKIAVDVLEIYLSPVKLTQDIRVNKMANLIHHIMCEFCEEQKKENCLYGDPELLMICFNKIVDYLESEVDK